MSELTDLQVAEQKIEFYKEQLKHERRMRKNADTIIKIQSTKIMKMSTKIEHLVASLALAEAAR